MSGVRLSPGSPSVERVSRAPSSPRTPARRCLFGPVDHEILARDLERSSSALEDEQRSRWNFDFANDRPLKGPLCWELAGPDIPDFYRRGPHPKPGAPGTRQRPKVRPDEETEHRSRKRNGEPADSSSPNMKKSRGIEAEGTAGGSLTPPPEKTPQKSKPST
ncbi:cyclin-dependent kinase inhibitor 1B-like [Rhinophrynus dorsalis]